VDDALSSSYSRLDDSFHHFETVYPLLGFQLFKMAQVERLWAIYEELVDSTCKNQQTTSEDAIRLKNRLQEVAKVVKAKTKGSLRVDFSASTGSSPKVEADVFLEGEDNDTTPEARRLPHESLSLFTPYLDVEYGKSNRARSLPSQDIRQWHWPR
jgi:hypothetical protein